MANFSSLIPIPDEYPTGSINIALALGGSGGTGGKGGTVNVTNNGRITTEGDFSHAIFAQSVGGGGGDGGKSIAATANISMPEGPVTKRSASSSRSRSTSRWPSAAVAAAARPAGQW
jgi:hypothetical protein